LERAGGGGSDCPAITLAETESNLLRLREWQRFRIEVFNSRILVIVDGEVVASVQDDEPIQSGRISLEAGHGATIHFDNVRVVELVPADAALPVTATVTQNANLRDGPSTDFAAVSSTSAGDQLTVLGQSDNGSWLQVRTDEGQVAWIAAYLVEIQGDVAAVPVRSG
jgi:hypothetical protein